MTRPHPSKQPRSAFRIGRTRQMVGTEILNSWSLRDEPRRSQAPPGHARRRFGISGKGSPRSRPGLQPTSTSRTWTQFTRPPPRIMSGRTPRPVPTLLAVFPPELDSILRLFPDLRSRSLPTIKPSNPFGTAHRTSLRSHESLPPSPTVCYNWGVLHSC